MEGDDYRQTFSRFHALVYYTQTQYFPVLTHEFRHILYWIPQNFSRLQQSTDLEIRFDVVPFRPTPEAPIRQGVHGKFSFIFDRNAIVIWCPKEKELGPLEPTPDFSRINWITGKDVPYGSLCLPYDAFVRKTLVLLERVNRETTVVPTFSGFIDGQWIIELATWGNARTTKATSCGCISPQPSCDGSLEYAYRNRDFWAYEHEGCSNNGRYVIECKA